jgi:tetratricopeptide (TPR) repeat protein
MTVRPTLTWEAVDKAKGYKVELRDGSGKAVLWKGGETTEKPRLEYPAKRDPLEYSASYQWRVTAKLEDGEEPAPEWNVLLVVTKAEGEELTHLKPLTESKEPADWLLAAVTYEAHGVYTESLALYEKLAKAVPGDANYHKALANYYERAGRTDEADKERAKAKKLGAVFPEK